MERFVIALFILFVGATAVAAQSGAANKVGASRRSVCTVAAFGNKFTVQKVGTTVFGNEKHEVPVDSWKVDELVASKLNALLSKRFQVQRIPTAIDPLEPLDHLTIFEDREAETRKVFSKLVGSRKCDFVLVVRAGGSAIGNTNQWTSGLGIVSWDSLLFPTINVVALSRISVYDGRTFERLKEERGSIGQETFMATIRGPHREVDKSWEPSPPSKAATDSRLKNAVLALLDRSLVVTIPALIAAD